MAVQTRLEVTFRGSSCTGLSRMGNLQTHSVECNGLHSPENALAGYRVQSQLAIRGSYGDGIGTSKCIYSRYP